MTDQEWLEIGYEKGIIELPDIVNFTFEEAYKDWFCMKQKFIKPQSLDRIEVTYNRYYFESEFTKMHIQNISDRNIIDFIDQCLLKNSVNEKEFARIYQIVNNVLVYFHDINYKLVPLHDWGKIKRSVANNKIVRSDQTEYAVKSDFVRELIFEVTQRRIYSFHQNCCLLLCMNFFMGLRVGELACLTFNDFDFDKNVIKISKTESKFYKRTFDGSKTGKMQYKIIDSTKTVCSIREIPILPEVKYFYELIKKEHEQKGYNSQYLAYDGQESVFVRCLDRTLRTLCTYCNIPYFSTHYIRKTFATKLHYGNVPTKIISDILGHSDISTTENYYIKSYDDNWNMVYNYMKDSLIY